MTWRARPSRAEIIQAGFSTPFDAPTIPAFPFAFRNAEILTLFFRTDPAAIAALLPEPLERMGDVVAIHIYRMNDTSWLGPYGECNVMVGATLGDISGGYSPYLFLSSEIGVAHGREIHGQPKKLGTPTLEARGDLLVGSVSRNGIEIITGTMPYKQHSAEAGAALSKYFDITINMNLKALDHIDNRPAVRQITSRQLSNIAVHECWTGPCTVELRPNAQAPVFRLPVVEHLDGVYWRADFTLVPGVILHDYLTGD